VKVALILVALAALSACSDKPEERVRELLNDPDSAKFSDVGTAGKFTCGFVNGKNTLGAYAGKRAFIVEDEFVQIETADDAAAGPSGVFWQKFTNSCPKDVASKYALFEFNRRHGSER